MVADFVVLVCVVSAVFSLLTALYNYWMFEKLNKLRESFTEPLADVEYKLELLEALQEKYKITLEEAINHAYEDVTGKPTTKENV